MAAVRALLLLLLGLVCGTRSEMFSTRSTHSRLLVDTRTSTFRILRANLSDEVDMGLTIPPDTPTSPCSVPGADICLDYEGVAQLSVRSEDHCQVVTWISRGATELKDCVILKGHWYGGGEQFTQPWPIEKHPMEETAYVTADMLQLIGEWYGGVTEAYWISSQGIAVYVPEEVPLFLSLVDTTDDGVADEMCLAARKDAPFDARQSDLLLQYYLCSADDVREVHEATLPKFYARPSSIPDEEMIRDTVWTTWAEYKTEVNDTKVLDLAHQVIDRGYPYSHIEIDDNWETCYGSATFNPDRFADPTALVNELHALGFRVTIWIHPFINDNCEAFTYADENGYFVKSADGVTQLTSWWQGNSAGIIDFTNTEAVDWWTARLRNIQTTTGMDGFKFDAGETNWLPDVFTLNASLETWPNVYTMSYVNMASTFGGITEVRSGRHNQHSNIFFRMLDKNSNFNDNNGVQTLIPTLLHFGILGYPFVLPDMIGGNAYGQQPSEELFVRWTQANALMPAMQFSLLPWRFGSLAEEVSLNASRLHVEFTPRLLQAAVESTTSVAAINRPTWWLCPLEEDCLTADQQYLLGDDVLVAPVVVEGAVEKEVVLPPGDWVANVDGVTYSGPGKVVFTDVTLDKLVYLTRV
ncbi:Glycoside hydrolase family 31 [Trinorchestia longiramus]|nr:Glycoside hydrolase family 31 [Trinorchestia longiramus]